MSPPGPVTEQCDAVFTKKRQLRWHKLEHLALEASLRKKKDFFENADSQPTEENPSCVSLTMRPADHAGMPPPSSSLSLDSDRLLLPSTPSRCCSTTATTVTSMSSNSRPSARDSSEERDVRSSSDSSSFPFPSPAGHPVEKHQRERVLLQRPPQALPDPGSREPCSCALSSLAGEETKTADHDHREKALKSHIDAGRGEGEEKNMLPVQSTSDRKDEDGSDEGEEDRERRSFLSCEKGTGRGGEKEGKGDDASLRKQEEDEKKEPFFHCPHANCEAVFTSLHRLYRHLKRVSESKNNSRVITLGWNSKRFWYVIRSFYLRSTAAFSFCYLGRRVFPSSAASHGYIYV